MSVTDAEKAFYESVIASPEGKSIQDLRYAYFLAALDGGLPGGGGGTVDSIVAGANVTVDSTNPASPVVSATVPDDVVTSANASVSGVEFYPTVGDFPGVGTAGVLYFTDAV